MLQLLFTNKSMLEFFMTNLVLRLDLLLLLLLRNKSSLLELFVMKFSVEVEFVVAIK